MSAAINELIRSPEYDLLRTDERLKDRVVLLTLSGEDICGSASRDRMPKLCGVTLSFSQELAGLKSFAGIENDTLCIYVYREFIESALSGEPEALELLGYRKDLYATLERGSFGTQLIHSRKLFLSLHCVEKLLRCCVLLTVRIESEARRKHFDVAGRMLTRYLYLQIMILDLLEKGDIISGKEPAPEFRLPDDRKDCFSADGTFAPAVIDTLFTLNNRIGYATKNTSLPEEPDRERANQLVLDALRFTLNVEGRR